MHRKNKYATWFVSAQGSTAAVNKEMHFSGDALRNWQPYIVVDEINLYVRQVEGKGKSAHDFKYVSTLNMSKPQLCAENVPVK